MCSEGEEMHEVKVQGCWDEQSAGGCLKHPATYSKNPAWQVHIKRETDFFMRLAVTSQTVKGKVTLDPE